MRSPLHPAVLAIRRQVATTMGAVQGAAGHPLTVHRQWAGDAVGTRSLSSLRWRPRARTADGVAVSLTPGECGW